MIDDFKKPDEHKPARLDGFRGSMPGADTNDTDMSVDTDDGIFHPPEEVASQSDTVSNSKAEEHLFLPPLNQVPEIEAHSSQSGKWYQRLVARLKKPDLTKKQWIIVGVVALVLIGGGTAFALTRDKPAPVAKKAPAKIVATPAPAPVLSPLTGIPVSKEQQARPVTGVMIENSPDARPQSGLDQAGVVFEAIAEAGITRFLALYQETNPGVVGPVRSSRPYYLDWAMAFDASYAHVGGSPDALQRIKDIGVKDLDQFYNSSAYRRDSKRFAPHNVYTSLDQLVELGYSKGWKSSTFTPLVRKAKEEPLKIPTAKTVDFSISGAFYNVHYDYDPAKNFYLRNEGGAIHNDNEAGTQLAPKVVVALAMPYSLMDDGYHSQYQTTGTGSMLVFQDGNVTPGTWSKGGPKDQFVFKDGAGKPLKLNPGQTWFTVVDDISKATYAP